MPHSFKFRFQSIPPAASEDIEDVIAAGPIIRLRPWLWPRLRFIAPVEAQPAQAAAQSQHVTGSARSLQIYRDGPAALRVKVV